MTLEWTLAALACVTVVAAVPVANKMIQVEGTACDGNSTFHARVFYPTDNTQKYPILSFAHGAVSGDILADPLESYKGTVEGVAGAGYIVIGLSDCAANDSGEWKEQVDSLIYMRSKEQTLKGIIDYNASTGIFGHSMGAESTLISSSDDDSVREAKIASAVAMHPGTRFHTTLLPKIATLYWTGAMDHLSTPASAKAKYEQVSRFSVKRQDPHTHSRLRVAFCTWILLPVSHTRGPRLCPF
jgi:hypothetical protein